MADAQLDAGMEGAVQGDDDDDVEAMDMDDAPQQDNDDVRAFLPWLFFAVDLCFFCSRM